MIFFCDSLDFLKENKQASKIYEYGNGIKILILIIWQDEYGIV
jgi:hypothetical protein